ncbi:hypothetical protein AB4Z48_04555 [Cupriavidus sp. 2TAF22]|uniref:hypothetical protein n=1 Tax=unclassified Cupriavidus TaxID=2640874 RepID=UPI003F924027
MDPTVVISTFERIATDETVELSVDDAVAGLAALLASEPFSDAARALLEKVGATLYRVGLDGYDD